MLGTKTATHIANTCAFSILEMFIVLHINNIHNLSHSLEKMKHLCMCWSSFWQTMPTMTPFVCQSNHMGSSTTIYKSIPWDGSFCICSSQQRNEILARVLSYVIRLFWKLWEMTRRLFFLFSFNALTWNSRIPTEKFDKGTVILKTSQPENITFKSQSHAIARLLLSRTLWDSRLMSSPTHIVCWFRMTSPMLCHLSTNNLYACRKQGYRKTVPPTCLARRVSARLNVQIDRSELASRNNAIARLFPRFSRDSKMVENDVSNVLFPKSRNIRICCWRWSWAAGLASKAQVQCFLIKNEADPRFQLQNDCPAPFLRQDGGRQVGRASPAGRGVPGLPGKRARSGTEPKKRLPRGGVWLLSLGSLILL